jgi:hypothetical protein
MDDEGVLCLHMGEGIDMTKILIDEAVVRQALEALTKNSDRVTEIHVKNQATTALRQALADTALCKMAGNARELGLDYMEGSAEQYEKELEQSAQPNHIREATKKVEQQEPDHIEDVLAMVEQPAQEPDPDELTIAYMSGVYEGKKAERKRIVNLLMIQHEAAKGAHNYWHVAANLIQAEVASDT